MLWNYVKFAIRTSFRNKSVTAINIIGLSIGMTASLLILTWVQNELSFDKDNADSDRIYRITSDNPSPNGGLEKMEYVPLLLGDECKKTIPEIQEVGKFFKASWAEPTLQVNNEYYGEKNSVYVDEGWFGLFNYTFTAGRLQDFLENPFSIILTESKALKYFGHQNPIGKTVKIDSNDYQVRAIVKDNAANSSFPFDVFLPVESYLSNPAQRKNELSWSVYNYVTFIKISETADVNGVAKKISNLLGKNGRRGSRVSLEPLLDIHFEKDMPNSVLPRGNKTPLYILSTLAILLLITASINYINLTTARSNQRSTEIAVKKIFGAQTKHLFGQLMVESLVIGVIAMFFTFLLVWLCLPEFSRITEKNFSLNMDSLRFWILLFAVLIFVVLLNGVYPAFVLCSFRPINVLRGIVFLHLKDIHLRRALVVIQFAISIFLLISTVVIYRQMNFIRAKDQTYNQSNVIAVSLPVKLYLVYTTAAQRAQLVGTIKNELLSKPAIEEITITNHFGMRVKSYNGLVDWIGKPVKYNPIVAQINADADYAKVFKLKVIAGRWFGSNEVSETHKYILNETAVRAFNFTEPVIGRSFIFQKDTGQIIGVVKDYNYLNFHQAIGPLVFFNDPANRICLFIKAKNGKNSEALAIAKEVWQKFIPGVAMDYNFLDDNFNALYKTEQKSSLLTLYLSFVSVFISALGLFGLATYMAAQKTKEIGIRRVLGAPRLAIVMLMSKEFLRMLFISVLISGPIAYLLINKWLQDFAYRVNIGAYPLLIAAAISLLFVVLTTGVLAIKKANANPATSLRSN